MTSINTAVQEPEKLLQELAKFIRCMLKSLEENINSEDEYRLLRNQIKLLIVNIIYSL